ncbi:MAG: DEAD/DEAH box helicase, partial [Moorea sp. SIO4A3]|nr:DEAD/DEAH box helicase [Moorena sp. SIO4A3]
HLPTDFYKVIAEYAIAPYRLGLTATPDRSDGRHWDLNGLIGPEVYRKSPDQLAGLALADHKVIQIKVKLSQKERDRYNSCMALRNDFLRTSNIHLGSIKGWQQFVIASARSQSGRRAMLAHREAKEIALGTDGKLRILLDLLAQHYPEKMLIFTNGNATLYRISQELLIPAITHQTPVKERHDILKRFREGEYRCLAASHVLNEGVDVPDARVAIILSGTGSSREYIQRLGRVLRKGKDGEKVALLYEVVAEDTSEERTSWRRHGGGSKNEPRRRKQLEGAKTGKQLELLPEPGYQVKPRSSPRAAESKGKWGDEDDEF